MEDRLTLVVSYLLLTGVALPAGKQKPTPPAPQEFTIGRRTFFDFGPPFDFYEMISVRPHGTGALIERITLTPQGHPCTQPATIEISKALVPESVTDLLSNRNPCAIPDKALRKELKRCKKCLTFSGVQIAMAVQCGSQNRVMRMDILDRDMFDPAPRTPEHTSWTMGLLTRLDKPLGQGVMERPVFSSFVQPAPPASELKSDTVEALSRGALDGLFKDAPDKPSMVYMQTKNRQAAPTVELLRSSVAPVSYTLPKYPPVAWLAQIAGQVSFQVDIAADGSVSNLKLVGGNPMLQKAVESELSKWRFPTFAAGQSVHAAIEFKTNCVSDSR